jgi:hypothetical protein
MEPFHYARRIVILLVSTLLCVVAWHYIFASQFVSASLVLLLVLFLILVILTD